MHFCDTWGSKPCLLEMQKSKHKYRMHKARKFGRIKTFKRPVRKVKKFLTRRDYMYVAGRFLRRTCTISHNKKILSPLPLKNILLAVATSSKSKNLLNSTPKSLKKIIKSREDLLLERFCRRRLTGVKTGNAVKPAQAKTYARLYSELLPLLKKSVNIEKLAKHSVNWISERKWKKMSSEHKHLFRNKNSKFHQARTSGIIAGKKPNTPKPAHLQNSFKNWLPKDVWEKMSRQERHDFRKKKEKFKKEAILGARRIIKPKAVPTPHPTRSKKWISEPAWKKMSMKDRRKFLQTAGKTKHKSAHVI